MKLLLYCTKAKPYLYHDKDYCFDTMNTIDLGYKTFKYTNERVYDDETGKFLGWANFGNMYEHNSLNGKIVAECDFEVEKIEKKCVDMFKYCYITDTLNEFELMNKTQLDGNTTNNYLKGKNGYAIHIKNLHIFDESRELYDCLIHPKIEPKYYGCEHLSKAPQNMMYAELDDIKYILISIRPEWLCKILNGEKTIEVRKKVLKGMIKNE